VAVTRKPRKLTAVTEIFFKIPDGKMTIDDSTHGAQRVMNKVSVKTPDKLKESNKFMTKPKARQ